MTSALRYDLIEEKEGKEGKEGERKGRRRRGEVERREKRLKKYVGKSYTWDDEPQPFWPQ
jgi:hypothetical protein